MRNSARKAVAMATIMVLWPMAIAEDLAFKTALGHGRLTKGGRGGILIKVTNNSDVTSSGFCQPGDSDGGTSPYWNAGAASCSSDATCDGASGNGNCIFAALGSGRRAWYTERASYIVPIPSGYIDQTSSFVFNAPGSEFDNKTYFGQAAFGDGQKYVGDRWQTQNVAQWIVRFKTVNPAGGPSGPNWIGNGGTAETSSAYTVRGDADLGAAYTNWSEDLIWDHVTINGGADEGFLQYGGTRRTTVQFSHAGNSLYVVGKCCEETTPGSGFADCLVNTTTTKRACFSDAGCTSSTIVDYCDVDAISSPGHAYMQGGNFGNLSNNMREVMDLTTYRVVASHAYVRNLKLGGTQAVAVGDCKLGGGSCGSGTLCCDAPLHFIAADQSFVDVSTCDGVASPHSCCTGVGTGCDAQTCTVDSDCAKCVDNGGGCGIGTDCCNQGYRKGETCVSDLECPFSDHEGTIDWINTYSANPGPQSTKAGFIPVGSEAFYVGLNWESSRALRGGLATGGGIQSTSNRRTSLVNTGALVSDDRFYVNDLVLEYEGPGQDGTICDRPFTPHYNCAVNGDCVGTDCDTNGDGVFDEACECNFTEACPESAPCDTWEHPLNARDIVNGRTDSRLVEFFIPKHISTKLGPATYVGVDASLIAAVADVDDLLVGPQRQTGDCFPFEDAMLEATLDEDRDGTGHAYHCPWPCTDTSPTWDGTYNLNWCAPSCRSGGVGSGANNEGTWTGDSGAVEWYTDDRFDGVCNDGGADCRCEDITTESGGSCASVAHCTLSTTTCDLGVTTSGHSFFANGLGGYWDDSADEDGLGDAWEIANFGSTGAYSTNDTCTQGVDVHYTCIEAFMMERIGETMNLISSGGDPGGGVGLLKGGTKK